MHHFARNPYAKTLRSPLDFREFSRTRVSTRTVVHKLRSISLFLLSVSGQMWANPREVELSDRVSVILPTYNRADLIVPTIESLLAQTRPIDEILVLDDGSTDDTVERLAPYRDRIRYHRKENGGKAAALNLALTMTKGDFIWICDDDDLLLPDACERLMGAFEADPSLDFCAGVHEDFIIDPATSKMVRKPPGYLRKSAQDEIFADALDGCHLFQPGLIVRRAHYDAVGPFDEKLTRSQDYQMLLRLTRHGKGRVLPEIVFLHREHQGARGSAKERFSTEEANRKWIKYHRIIMEPLLADLTDREVLPPAIWNDPDREAIRDRTATVRRGAIFGRHVLWQEALNTWQTLDLSSDADLDDYEIQAIRNSTGYSLGCAPLLESAELLDAVKELKKRGPLGRQIVRELGRSLFWRVKQSLKNGDVRSLYQLLRFIAATR